MTSNNNKSRKGVFGIHHVTAITSNPQKNIDFYTGDLGLRLVKLSVNQDDPTAYHLYFGDELGRPGTILTFFHWPNIPRGRRGTSQVIATSFLIPENSINHWIDRFKSRQIEYNGPYKRFNDEKVITFHDPDGLELELVAHTSAEDRIVNVWKKGPIPVDDAIRGFYSVTLAEEGYASLDSGEVLEVNDKAVGEPETINDDPYGDGWLVRIRMADAGEVEALLDADAYKAHVADQ